MSRQLIISIGREFGSGGHEIAEMMAQKLNLELLDKDLLSRIADEKSVNVSELQKYDEVPRNVFFSRNVRGYSNSMEENIANMQFEYLRKKAQNGDSFIIVGRCAEYVLKDCPALVSIFVLGDWDHKIDRITRLYGISPEEADRLITREDRKRKNYHNSYCKGKWGDSRNYDISVNSSRLGEEETSEVLINYIDRIMKQ